MSNKLTVDQCDVLEEFANNNEASIYYNYSGRLMYGKNCFGFDLDRLTNPCQFCIKLINHLHDVEHSDLAEKLANKVAQDSMGLGSIIYFPSLEWMDGADEEEEEEEEVE